MPLPGANSPEAPPRPRLCHLRKGCPEQGYGFKLHADKKRQFIGDVEAHSPADVAGLTRGDRIVAVNGVPLNPQEDHVAVVQRIKQNPLQCRFVVIDEAGFFWYSSRKMPIPLIVDDVVLPLASIAADVDGDIDAVAIDFASVARAEVQKCGEEDAAGGDTIAAATDAVGTGENADCTSALISNVAELDDEGDATSASLSSPICQSLRHEGDGLNEAEDFVETALQSPSINEKRKATNSDVVRHVVIEEPNHQLNGHTTPGHSPRMCTLKKLTLDEEYGFNLHAEKDKGHFIGKVDDQSPAQRAGLLQSWRIVGVNGTLIFQKTPHKEVVALIKTDPMKTQLLIVSPELDAQYAENQRAFSFDEAEIFPHNGVPSDQIGDSISKMENGGRHVEESHVTHDLEKVSCVSTHHNENGTILADVHFEKLSLNGQHNCDANENGVNALQNDGLNNGNSKECQENEPVDIFHMSAMQMRERVLRRKKVDPRKESMPLREKYDIIQNL